MYVVVEHTISDPARLWKSPPQAPEGVTLHHTFANQNGTRAVCVWEAASVEAVRAFLEPATASMSRNEYYQVPNKEGISLPAGVIASYGAPVAP